MNFSILKIKSKSLTLLLFLLFVSAATTAQEFEVPEDFRFTDKSDYESQTENILKCIEWLQTSPYDENIRKRKRANAYLIDWLTGTSSVTVELHSYVADLTKKNPDLLPLFMGGWAKESLLYPASKTNVKQGSIAGMESLVDFYVKNKSKGLEKDKNVEKLVKLRNKDKLVDWVESQII